MGLALAFTAAPPEPPANDAFADATALTNGAMSGGGTLEGGTAQPGEPAHGGTAAARSVWFRWIAPRSSLVVFEAEGAAGLRAAIYTGAAVDTLNLVVGSAAPASTQALEFFAVGGVEYRVALDGAGGTFAFLLSFLAPPNDAFADAIVLTSAASVSASGFNFSATAETGEPAHAGTSAAASVWWKWTAPTAGIATITVGESGLEVRLAVYTGGALTALTPVASASEGFDPETSVSFAAVAGAVYSIAVDGAAGSTGDIALSVDLDSGPTIPPNDDFADAEDLGSGTLLGAYGSNVNATAEADEPEHAGQPPLASIWWKWTAPANGLMTVDTLESELDTVLAIYTGTSLDALILIVSNDDAGAATPQSAATFSATAGAIFYFAVDGFGGDTAPIILNLSPGFGPLVPPNDDFANATDLGTDALLTVLGANVNATAQAGEPSHAGNPPTATVWWKWTAPASATVTVDTFGSAPDTLLAIYTGPSLGSLTSIASNDDADGGTLQSAATFAATAGTLYRIAVDGFGGAGGALTLNLNTSAPDNDHFADAENLGSGADLQLTANNSSATAEAGELAHAGRPAAHTLWWRWTAPANMGVEIETLGSEFDTVLAVYTGASANALVLVASNDNAGSGDVSSRVAFSASAGTVYHVAIGSAASGEAGAIALALRETTIVIRPANDDFLNATPLASAASVNAAGHNANATAEPGEPAHSDAARTSVWWKWTAPSYGRLTIDTLGSAVDTALAVYVGPALNALTRIAANDDASASSAQSQATLQVSAGVTYRIAVDGFAGSTGAIALQLRLASGLAPQAAYNLWQTDSFPSSTPAADREPGRDFDKDGLANGIEYLMSLDPAQSSASALTIHRIEGATVLTYPRRRDAPAGIDSVQATADLSSWTNLNGNQATVVLTDNGPLQPDTMQVTIPDSLGFRFFRLSVTTTP